MNTTTRGNLSDFFPYQYKLCIQIYHYGEVPKIEMREMKYLKKS